MNTQGIQSLANAGRFGDTDLIHVTKGEVVIPPTILSKNPSLLQAIKAELAKEDTSIDEVTVGSSLASINPETGLQEFFLKSLFKKVKKVGSKLVRGLKKVAPVAAALFIPGVGGALGGALGSVGSAIGSGITSLFPSLSGAVGTIGNLGSSFLGTAENFRNALTSGIGSLFGGGEQPLLTDESGFPMGVKGSELGPFGTDFNIKIPGVGESATTASGVGSTGSFFGRRTPDFIRGIEDIIKNPGEGIASLSDSFEGATGINPFYALLAKKYGDSVEDAYRKRMGGLSDVRDSIRSDLASNVFGGTPTFDLGFAEGGEVMDMRDGGESVGPGTGTSDDIPAMLSDGEFVMTAKANMGAGALDLVEEGGIMQLIPSGEPSREKGADNMMKLMRYFEAKA